MTGLDVVLVISGLLAAWGAGSLTVLGVLYGGARRRTWLVSLVCRLNGYRYLGRNGVVFQTGALACGAACVEMVLRFRGVPDPTDQLRDLRLMAGTSMLDLKRAFGDFGLNAEGRPLGGSAVLRDVVTAGADAIIALDATYITPRRNLFMLPISLLVAPALRRFGGRTRHWVVVRAGSRAEALAIYDPYLGVLEVEPSSLGDHWDGTALVVGP